jgi:uncharacterized protein YeaO (DUF488 family)/DNA-binding MarR family transcriptional regulator
VVRVFLTEDDYARLLRLRMSLRQYLHWSGQQALAAGLTPTRHQLLLAIRGHGDPRGPTISDVAAYLLLKQHSAVELAQRAEALDLVRRVEDPDDRRVVRLLLTAKGAAALEKLASLHREELTRLASDLRPLRPGHEPGQVQDGGGPAGAIGPPRLYPVRARQVLDAPGDADGARVLVERLWPRGLNKNSAPVDHWYADLAPSTQLRRWYGHKPDRFAEFADRYRGELRGSQATDSLERLADLARRGPLTLLTTARHLALSGASVLAEEIRRRDAPAPGPGQD